jgi:sugar lactone lactonase YvrE
MENGSWEVVTDHVCMLGEGPVWDHREKRILWVDILNGQIHYFYPGTNEHKLFNTGQITGSVALRKSGGLIAALKEDFAAIDLDQGNLQIIKRVETHLPDNRFNDGKCDPAGRFWAGSMSVFDTRHAGSLYLLEKDFTVTTKIRDVTCSNGLAWSPDHKTFYYIDTPTRKVAAYQYDLTSGRITDRSVVIDIPETEGYPDGMTIDTEGMLWIALWGGWKVIRYNPYTGKQLHQIRLPVSKVSSCVFGGDTMEDLYVTSASTGLAVNDLQEQPLAGSLFVIKNSGFKGMDAFEFDG